MEIIAKLSDMIEEELDDAEKYVNCATKVRAEYPTLAEAFYKLSVAEMDHMKTLHDETAAIITAYRKEHGEPPAGMMAVYEYLHKKSMDHAAEVRIKQNLFREV